MGTRDDELMARWVQYGVFSPINRLHSTDNPFNGKEPWKFDKITQSVMEEYLRLRHSLVPYLYTMNRRAHTEDLPLIQPMYYMEPEQDVLPVKRTWKLVFTAVEKTTVETAADGNILDADVSYCSDTSCLTVEIPAISVDKELCISFPQGLSIAEPGIEERCYKVLDKAQIEYDVKANVLDNVKNLSYGIDPIAVAIKFSSVSYGAPIDLVLWHT